MQTQNTIPKHFPYIDTLFDYAEYLRNIDTNNGIGICTDPTVTVAIIGTGAGGIITAHELLKSGVKNVHLYTPEDISYRPYGRCHSVPFKNQADPENPVIAELGAMRFPISSVGLFHYIHKYNIPYISNFPNPGQVKTLLRTNGKSYAWEAKQTPPDIFAKLDRGWKAFIYKGFTTNEGVHLTAPATLATLLKNQEIDAVIPLWQQWIDTFERVSFELALYMIFQKSDNPPGGENWDFQDIQLFGTLGVGSGGFNPVFSLGFTTQLHLFVNELEVQQQFIPQGIQSVIDAIACDVVGPYNTCVKDNIHQMANYNLDTQVIQNANGNKKYRIHAGEHQLECDYVIFALPTWALQLHHKQGLAKLKQQHLKPNVSIFQSDQLRAIAQQHLISSAKIFVQTDKKFWLSDEKCYQNIQSDTIGRGFYCLDYNPQDPNGQGVVLISYTWEDDANKISALQHLSPWQQAEFILDTLQNIDGAEHTIDQVRKHMIDVQSVFWNQDLAYHGAFKLNYAGQHSETQNIYWDYTKSNTPNMDSQCYFVGCSVSFYGGWIEGALQTALNASTAVMVSLSHQGKAKNIIDNNPVYKSHAHTYNYDC